MCFLFHYIFNFSHKNRPVIEAATVMPDIKWKPKLPLKELRFLKFDQTSLSLQDEMHVNVSNAQLNCYLIVIRVNETDFGPPFPTGRVL